MIPLATVNLFIRLEDLYFDFYIASKKQFGVISFFVGLGGVDEGILAAGRFFILLGPGLK